MVLLAVHLEHVGRRAASPDRPAAASAVLPIAGQVDGGVADAFAQKEVKGNRCFGHRSRLQPNVSSMIEAGGNRRPGLIVNLCS